LPFPIAYRYLELADWELKEALQSAKEDREWEQEESHGEELKSGQIGVRINFDGKKPLLNLKGIGKSTKNALMGKTKAKRGEDKTDWPQPQPKERVVVYSTPPAIATKTVMAQDLFNVSKLWTVRYKLYCSACQISQSDVIYDVVLGCSSTQ
jgi:hypothetical protein